MESRFKEMPDAKQSQNIIEHLIKFKVIEYQVKNIYTP